MKNKILGLPKAAVIVIGIVITALFLVLGWFKSADIL